MEEARESPRVTNARLDRLGIEALRRDLARRDIDRLRRLSLSCPRGDTITSASMQRTRCSLRGGWPAPFVGEEIRTRPTIDIHPHVISTDTERYPNAPVGGHKSDWSRERPVSVDQMIAAMDQAGIAKSALVQASTCYGHDNSYVADAVAAHPNRFTGVFSVDVLAPDAPEKIRYWVGRKLTGMRLFTAGSTMPNQADWVDDPRSFRPGSARANSDSRCACR